MTQDFTVLFQDKTIMSWDSGQAEVLGLFLKPSCLKDLYIKVWAASGTD